MSHPQQREFIAQLKGKFKNYFTNSTVLEVGSLNINGTVRDFFSDCNYKGIDVGPGPCVDEVVSGHEFKGLDNYYDTVISCECFEHNPFWVQTFRNMHRMTKSGGLVIMTCATEGRAEHGTSRSNPYDSPLTIRAGWEYYKNLKEQDFVQVFELNTMFKEYEFSTNNVVHDLYFWGIKI